MSQCVSICLFENVLLHLSGSNIQTDSWHSFTVSQSYIVYSVHQSVRNHSDMIINNVLHRLVLGGINVSMDWKFLAIKFKKGFIKIYVIFLGVSPWVRFLSVTFSMSYLIPFWFFLSVTNVKCHRQEISKL